ncbi:MAG: T9SS type A sorting domain-containing protein, partial [Cryomorphaceae bacterium]
QWYFWADLVYNLAFGTEQAFNVSEVSYESGIKLVQNYPNPVRDNTMIQFQLDESSAVTFEVFDITGKLVHSEDLGNVPALTNQIIDFNRAGLASGTYTYGVVTETERLTRKLIIQ